MSHGACTVRGIRQQGQLGVLFEADKGGVKVIKVLNGSPAARTTSQLKVGDLLQSINGQRITTHTNTYELLEGQSGQRVWLVVNRGGQDTNIYIRPVRSLKKELYESWIDWQKKLKDKYSNGTIGYIHIQGMNWNSFERFQRELTASGQGKEGIVIDVRYNGGGWTTDMLMAILNVKQHAYTIPRGAAASLDQHQSFKKHYPYGERLPFPPLLKPTVTLCNESSYSNAEIFSHAYKHLKLGQLVGVPTFGAVISTGGHSLLDGSYVRMPFRAWYALGTNENMEWTPAIPDEIIFNSPDFKYKNEDLQLKRAVEILRQ